MKRPLIAIGLMTLACFAVRSDEEPRLASVDDLLAMPQPAPDHRFEYGDDPLQFAELRLPEVTGPFPVAVLLHGGCWLAQYGVSHLTAMAEALTDAGMATWRSSAGA